MRKNGLLTFLFACIPGTGQMYHAYMKRGISLLVLFAFNIFLTSLIPIAGIFLPVIWAYSFFDTFHIHDSINDAYANLKDSYLFGLGESDSEAMKSLFGKRHVLVGGGLILVGAYLLLDQFGTSLFVDLLQSIGFESASEVWHSIWKSIPSLFVSIILVILGIYLVIGKKPKYKSEEDYVEYKGVIEEHKEEQK